MANTDKDIVITPNTGQAAAPTISFVGFDNVVCTLTVNPNGTLTVNRQFVSSVATGTAPFAVSSTTRVANLNVATAGTAATLTTARLIGGVSFNGSANINLPGVNVAGNQNTTGSAATLTTARAINGTNFNGSAAITTVNWGTTRDINGTSVNGSANYAIGRIYDTNYRRFTNPGGGEFVTQASTVTGAVRLVFPNVFSNGMYRLTIQIYEYTTGESFTVYAGGHTSGTNWFNVFAYILGNPTTDRRFTVRFGRTAANKAAVYIGEINSAWAYPQVFLTEFQCGFSGFQDNSTGWTTDFTTAALENVTQTVTNCQIGYAVSTNTANSTVLRNASGNFSAGTVTAALTGNASTATTLQTARTINGTNFNGSAAITTANWGTARTVTIGSTGKSVNGSANVAWSLAEIGAAAASATVNLTGNQSIAGIKTFTTDVRAPIFYDSANTLFYVDPNSESRLSAVLRTQSRVDNTQRYPIGHYTPGETVFEFDPTWTENELRAYFNSASVQWVDDSTAPGGYAIRINGAVSVGGVYGSGFPYIPVDQNDIFYMECWIRSLDGSQGHYMGSIDFNQSFGNLGGNPGSFGYWTMTNTTVGTTWTKVTGYITGFGTATGTFKVGTKYWTPQALFNYTQISGTQACVISGWKVIKVAQEGNRTFRGAIQLTGNATSIRQTSTASWSGNPGSGVGKLEYHSNRWYAVAGSDSNRIIQFRRDGSDVSHIDNTGRYLGNVTAAGDVRAPIYYNNANTGYYWQPNSSAAHRLQTPTGALDIGSMNASFCHLQTDRPQFYFNRDIQCDGLVRIYADPNNRFGVGALYLRSTSPTVYLRDIDHNSAMLHCNSNLFYILRGPNDSESWATVNGHWPSYWNLTNNEQRAGGAIFAVGDVTAFSSDRRLKENIRPIENSLAKVLQLTGVTYDWKDTVDALGFTPPIRKNDAGLIAQDVEKVLPQAVAPAPFDQEWDNDAKINKSKSGDDYLTVKYEKLVPLLVNAIKEQQAQIDQQQLRIDLLEQLVTTMTKRD